MGFAAELRQIVSIESALPFALDYGAPPRPADPSAWAHAEQTTVLDAQHARYIETWHPSDSGLRVTLIGTLYREFRAVDWVLWLENAGPTDTPLIANLHALDVRFGPPVPPATPYRLHRTNGAPSNPTDFEPAVVPLDAAHPAELGGGGGRCSNRDLPFFTVVAPDGALVVAVGWSGQWAARLACDSNGALRISAGLERTHFRLHPGERVRTPRILLLHEPGGVDEAHARFRRLIYRHYAARRSGLTPLPTPYCNTCFTRGGGWLNECNAENQIALINAYARLGVEALWTDAGWFEGGWPAGAGNWTPRRDAYPDGMRPVAAAAAAHGMVYGLWFEPERVVAGTALHRAHPEWVLSAPDGAPDTYLANFGLPEVQEYFFEIVRGFMALPGFRVYRQDFNLDPLPYWRAADASDRQGVTEMHYIAGLYAFWDRLAATWPDGLREECASGGRRIDLETVARMHIHQKSDYWFDNEVDQASLWGLSQYLPNNVVMAPLNRMDDYSFHSALPSSLCLGWIADAPDFDVARGRHLLARYKAVRHLLVGAWYPLTPYSRRTGDWLAVQFHRPDLDEGLILIFRRAECPTDTLRVALRGLSPAQTYTLASDRTGTTRSVSGAELAAGLTLMLPDRPASDLLVYRGAPQPPPPAATISAP